MQSSSQMKQPKIERHNAEKVPYTFFDCICRFLYIIGIQTVRILRRSHRRISSVLKPVGILVCYLYSITLGKQLFKIKKELSFLKLSLNSAERNLKEAKKQGFFYSVYGYFRTIHGNFALHRHFVCSILNFVVPVGSIVLLVVAVHYWNGLNFGLSLSKTGTATCRLIKSPG